ncbi:MAG: CrcB family protein [Solirubrobacterales bacterium]|nr:CrcB family protein [Solirubrobacterales bacterium]
MNELPAVFLGGALGALARAGLAEQWPVSAGSVPWSTFSANLVGCLLLGAVLVRTTAGTPRRGLLGPGLCGGLTTFSTFQVELVDLLHDGDTVLALGYAALSLALGLAAVDLGRRLGGGAALAVGATEGPER